jgi:hypothetical protein
MWYHDFGDTLLTPEEQAALRASGQTPMVTWEPYNQSLSSIAQGSYDSYLRESATIAREWGGELMIRFAHEMNGTWYPWDGAPSDYVAAWRHIVTVFREAGATNVRWVWAPNNNRTHSMSFGEYFPGEEWVDYVGLDGYNWGSTPGNEWSSLREVFLSSYTELTALSSKPVIITETSSSEVGGDKAQWIRTGFLKTSPEEMPRDVAAIWFNKSMEDDWRINSSQASLEAFREVANCTLYGGTQPCAQAPSEEHLEEQVDITSIHVTPTPQVPGPAAAPRGTLSYRLNGKAKRVRIRVQRRARRHYRRRAVVTRKAHRGRTRISLRQLLRGKHLAAGRYRVQVIAFGPDGHRSRKRSAHFRVVR